MATLDQESALLIQKRFAPMNIVSAELYVCLIAVLLLPEKENWLISQNHLENKCVGGLFSMSSFIVSKIMGRFRRETQFKALKGTDKFGDLKTLILSEET